MPSKALRIAAWFLIGHYVILTGLELTSDSPSYRESAIALGLLVGAVSMLFKPRKRGWSAVAAYAAYILIMQVMELWPILTAPTANAAVMIIAAITIVVLNLPMIAGLILVFVPASLASFRNPVPDEAAKGA